VNAVSGTATPAPVQGQSSQVTTNFFDAMGRTIGSELPDGTYTTNSYPTGFLAATSGSRTYPVKYAYDAQGRMTNNEGVRP
jgi:hypothetical protein